MRAEQFLEMFLFTPEQQHTFISKLSGGEKKRLQLLAILYKNPNFLILDEPTNDLDLPTLTVLESFLEEYQGCLLVVSHDRYFMDKVVDELMIFEGEGKISRYMGTYTEYHIENKNKPITDDKKVEKEIVIQEKVESKEKNVETKPKKLSFKEQRELEEINKSLPILEAKKEELTSLLSDPNLGYDKIATIGDELQKIVDELEEKEFRWLELSE